MVRHIVCYQLADPSEENKRTLKDAFCSMKGKIPELLDIEAGADVLHSARSYDVALVCTFESLQAMEAYKANEDHKKVAAYVHSVVKSSVSVDFEY